jgi:spore coat protein U-like protein
MRRIVILIIVFLHLSPAGWAASGPLTVSATILSKNNCKLKTTTATLDFGALNPALPVDKTISAPLIFRCVGSDPVVTFLFSEDYGLYETGPGGNRMANTTLPGEYLPYSITLSPASGSFPKENPPTDHTLTVTANVKGTDFQNASAGGYLDTVTISLLP